MGTLLVKCITEHPNTLRKLLIEEARLQRVIEDLEEEPDPDIDEDEDGEVYKPNFEQNKNLVKLEAQIEKKKIKLQEAEGKADQKHRNLFPRATIGTAKAAEDTDPTVIKIREDIADLNEKKKLLEIETREGEWVLRNNHRLALTADRMPTAREQTKLEKKLTKAREDLEKTTAEIKALENQFEGYKLLVSMGITEI